MPTMILTPDIIKKAYRGEDHNRLNYRIAKARESGVDLLIRDSEAFCKLPVELKNYFLICVESLIAFPAVYHHRVKEGDYEG